MKLNENQILMLSLEFKIFIPSVKTNCHNK